MLPSIRKFILYSAIILFTGLVAYHNSFQGEFVFDDWLILDHARSWTSLSQIWQVNPKRFLPNLTFFLNYQISTDQVFSYHLVNFTFHYLTAIVVLLLVSILLPSSPSLLPLFISLLFISHPVQTEAVSYITQRYSIIAAFFYLLSILLFCLSLIKHQPRLRLLSLFSCILALFSKENSFSLPFTLFFTSLFIFKTQKIKNSLRHTWLYFFATGFIFLFIFTSPTSPSLPQATHGVVISPVQYFLTQINVVRTYLRLLILPIRQNLDYDYPITSSPFNLPTLSSIILLIGLTAVSFIYRRRHPLIFYGLIFFFLTLVVESSFIPIADVIFEHRLYLPSVGFFISLTVFLNLLFNNFPRRLIYLGTAFIIALLCLATVLRNRVWQTEVTLWQDAVSKSPHKARVHYNLGVSYGYINRYDLAQSEFQTAISLNPYYLDAYHNLGAIYEKQGDIKNALNNYLRAFQLDSKNPQIQASLKYLLNSSPKPNKLSPQ